MTMIIFKRKVIFAYAVTCSSISIGLVVWVFLFIAAQQPAPKLGGEKMWAKDLTYRREVDRSGFRQPKQEDRKDGSDILAFEKVDIMKVYQTGPALIPNNTQLRKMTWSELSILYHRYLSQTQYICDDIERRGRVTDGGWDVCDDKGFKPHAPCIVYSFGVGNDFSFDDAMASVYHCNVYSFDPSMDMRSIQRGERTFFYKQGLADSDRILPNGWVMGRIESIRASLKHVKNPIHTVKLDIEEWEWEVLPDLLASDFLSAVTQLLVEFHQCDGCSKYDPEQEDKEPSRDRYIHMLELLHQLYQLKYRIFHHHHNRACNYVSKFTLEETSACSEIGFLRIS